MQTLNQEERTKAKALEEQIFSLKEQLTKNGYEMEKILADKNYVQAKVDELQQRLKDEQ